MARSIPVTVMAIWPMAESAKVDEVFAVPISLSGSRIHEVREIPRAERARWLKRPERDREGIGRRAALQVLEHGVQHLAAFLVQGGEDAGIDGSFGNHRYASQGAYRLGGAATEGGTGTVVLP